MKAWFGAFREREIEGSVVIDLSSKHSYVSTGFLKTCLDCRFKRAIEMAPKLSNRPQQGITLQNTFRKDNNCEKNKIVVIFRMTDYESGKKTRSMSIEACVIKDDRMLENTLVIGEREFERLIFEVGQNGMTICGVHRNITNNKSFNFEVSIERWVETTLKLQMKERSDGVISPALYGEHRCYLFDQLQCGQEIREMPKKMPSPLSFMNQLVEPIRHFNEYYNEYLLLPIRPYNVYGTTKPKEDIGYQSDDD